MKIAILGATGRIGSRAVVEAIARQHTLTAVAREPGAHAGERITPRRADATRADQLEEVLQQHDAVISAIGPRHDEAAPVIVDAARALAAAAMRARVKRIIVVGGAGSLMVEPGVELLATPEFPEAWREVALAHREALEIWRRVKELDWTYVSPAASIEPGTRTGHYRVGHNDLLLDDAGQSRISIEDFAKCVIDEVEYNTHLHERITVAY